MQSPSAKVTKTPFVPKSELGYLNILFKSCQPGDKKDLFGQIFSNPS